MPRPRQRACLEERLKLDLNKLIRSRTIVYASRFETGHSRAMVSAQRIRVRLGGPEWAGLDGNDPPKPKWMRQATYRRLLERSWAYEDIADEHVLVLAQQLGVLG